MSDRLLHTDVPTDSSIRIRSIVEPVGAQRMSSSGTFDLTDRRTGEVKQEGLTYNRGDIRLIYPGGWVTYVKAEDFDGPGGIGQWSDDDLATQAELAALEARVAALEGGP